MSEPVNKRAGLFDLRYVLALLFVVYGVVVTIMGLGFTSQAGLDKAAGVNINLWSGVMMLVLGVVFALWARLRPITVGPVTTTESADDAGGEAAHP